MIQHQLASENTLRAINFTKKWYGRSIPSNLDKNRFLYFVMNSTELARQISDAEMRVDFRASSAYTDGKKIFMPAIYFSPEFFNFIGIDSDNHVAAAITCINGSQIHEAIHIIQTECDLSKMVAINSQATKIFHEYKAFATILNIVEDIYIEEWCRYNFAGLSQFIDAKNEVLLGDHPASEAFERLYSEEVTTDDLLSALALLKNTRIAASPNWAPWKEIVDTCEKARNHNLAKADRVDIALQVFELFKKSSCADGTTPMPTGSQMKPGSANNSFNIDKNGRAESEFIRSLAKAISQALQGRDVNNKAIGIDDDEYGEDNDPLTDPEARSEAEKNIYAIVGVEISQFEQLGEDLNKEIVKIEKEFRAKRGEGNLNLDKIPKPILKHIDEVAATSRELLVEDQDFKRLGEYLRYMREKKTTLGRARDQGSVVIKQRLHRIATDGKILANRDSKKLTKGRPEVVILVDISGSMQATRGSAPGEYLITSASRAAMSSFGSFMRAGVPCSVFAHTTDSNFSATSSLIYAVAGFQMPLHNSNPVISGNYIRQFSLLLSAEHNANADGIAIEYCTTRFTSHPGSKILIVLCDGEPAGGYNYRGDLARNHTKQMVIKARRQGIHVIAVSLVESVVPSNDEIYGSQNNLRGYGSQLEPTLKQIVQRLSLS